MNKIQVDETPEIIMTDTNRNERGQFVKDNKAAAVDEFRPPTNAAEVIRKLASRGISEVNIAAALGCSRPQYQKWRDDPRYPELRSAWEEGREIEHTALFSVLFRKALKAEDHDSFISAMFLLKTRHGYRENEKLEDVALLGQLNISITMDNR